jgi:hypothetical protein
MNIEALKIVLSHYTTERLGYDGHIFKLIFCNKELCKWIERHYYVIKVFYSTHGTFPDVEGSMNSMHTQWLYVPKMFRNTRYSPYSITDPKQVDKYCSFIFTLRNRQFYHFSNVGKMCKTSMWDINVFGNPEIQFKDNWERFEDHSDDRLIFTFAIC